jgi:hypothetical protein
LTNQNNDVIPFVIVDAPTVKILSKYGKENSVIGSSNVSTPFNNKRIEKEKRSKKVNPEISKNVLKRCLTIN